MQLPITGGFYSLPSTSVSNQRCVNLYTHIAEGASETQEQLQGFSGINENTDTGLGKTRGAIVFQNELYRVDGNSLVRITQFGVVDNVSGSETVTGNSRLFLAENGESICIVDPYGNTYFYDKTNGLVKNINADFQALEAEYGKTRCVTYLDGYFVFNTDKVLFQSSLPNVNKGQNFNALEFDDADQFPDDLVSVVASQGNLYAFGVDSFEIYRTASGTTTGDFAFTRVSTQNNERGLVGRYNLINADSAVYFIGGGKFERPSVWELRGAQLNKISTDAVDSLIEDYDNGFALAWSERGQFFRAFTFDKTTLVYNARTSRWCEIQENNFTEGWQVQTINRVYGRLSASNLTGKEGTLDKEYFTWFGDTILDYCTSQPFGNQRKPFAVQWLEAVCQSGVGTDTRTNPTIAMSYSRDGGVTFGNERYRELGAQGDRTKRQRWYLLGRMDEDIVLKFSFSEPCQKTLIGLEASII